MSADEDWHKLAWAGALLITATVLTLEHRGAHARILEAELTHGCRRQETRRRSISSDLSFYYGATKALKNITLPLIDRKVTAFIGPSGCGKSTLLRVLNRIYELYPKQRAEGEVHPRRREHPDSRAVDINLLRSRVGMVFQKPTPFPMTIYDNIAFGIKLYERMPRSELDGRIEARAAARGAMGRGEGQAAGFGLEPFRRPAAAPLHRAHRGDEARSHPARRAVLGARSDLDREDRGADRRTLGRVHDRDRDAQHAAGVARVRLHRVHVSGRAVEYGPTEKIFTAPENKRTEQYITGRFG